MQPSGQKEKRRERTDSDTTTITNEGSLRHGLMIGVPTLGVIRIEWDTHRRGLIIPINWQVGEMIASHAPASVIAQGYTVSDAQNVILENFMKSKGEFLLLYEDDVLPPPDAFLRLNDYMNALAYPIIGGLYFSKGTPSWPLIFRGRGNGAFMNFQLGDLVMVDGVHTGFTMFHRSILEWFWKNSPTYRLPDGREVPRVFEQPNRAWIDPETNTYFSEMGTSDLYFCNRLLKEQVLKKTGWTQLAKEPYPILCDTNIFCEQIDLNGTRYPKNAEIILSTGREQAKRRKAHSNGHFHKHI